MKKFSITLISLVSMTGLALAQAKPDPKTGAAGAAPGGATAVKPAAGSASGGAKAGAGGGTAVAAAGGSTTAPAAPPKVEAPKPPVEIKDALKAMGTRQNCTGVTWGGPDGKQEMKVKGAGTNALALDGWWIKGGMSLTMGEGKQKMVLKMDSYMTYDAKLGKWRTVGVANDGSVMVGIADMKDGKYSSASDMYGGMMGDGKFRETGDMTDPKAGMKMAGEMSVDGGKTWNKVYEMACKK